ncbi:hypothetical protein [Nodularia sp. LEGE 04288]|uniref:hypothetical protein n=1 Tax=Nodularia sp. LEGE 04288 TaxID=1828639 RepID=UPI001D10F9EE|nr:hypothetical protein [Nodularia sp. LEGE 04288]MCC2695231.1 hypothetical protein [Nodularia sp. LEGE 04288]
MPSKKPQFTIRIEEDEYLYLQEWAQEEFMTPPQLAKILLKKAIASKKKEKGGHKTETA